MRNILIAAVAGLLCVTFALSQPSVANAAQSPVIINAEPLTVNQVMALEQMYGPVPAGDYWYDAVSGLYGVRGGPALGQIAPDLLLGGVLQADASSGDTGIFINGREIHMVERAYLEQMFGPVPEGRYWLNSLGIGGHEGGPAQFSLNLSASSGATEAGYNLRTAGGNIGSDGNCFYYNHPNGSTVSNC